MEALNEGIAQYTADVEAAKQQVFDTVQQDEQLEAEKGSLASILGQATNIGIGAAQLGQFATQGTRAEAVFSRASGLLQGLKEKMASADAPDDSLFGQLSAAARSGAAEGGLRGALSSVTDVAKSQAQEAAQPFIEQAQAAREEAVGTLQELRDEGTAAVEDLRGQVSDAADEGSALLEALQERAGEAAAETLDSQAGLVPLGRQVPVASEADLFDFFGGQSGQSTLAGARAMERPALDDEFGDEVIDAPRLLQQAGGIGKGGNSFANAQRITRGIDVGQEEMQQQAVSAADAARAGLADGAQQVQQAQTAVGEGVASAQQAAPAGQAPLEDVMAATSDVVQDTVSSAVDTAQVAASTAAEAVGGAVSEASGAVAGFLGGLSAELAPVAGPLALAVGIGAGIYSLVREIQGALHKPNEAVIAAAQPVASYSAPTS